jgi:uncharacterized protein
MAQVTGLPVQEQERIQDIDILRGFAILGILLVNMMFFAYPFEKSFISYATLSVTDKIAAGFIQIFATAKFYTLFSLLFGVGLAVQISRTDARAINLRPLYRRRLLVLLLIGLVHGLLIWYGDILMTYALTGFLLSLFRRRKQKTVLIWAASLLTLMMLLPVARYIYVKNTTHSAAEALEKKQERREKIRQAGSDATKNYRYGTLRDIQEQRTKDFAKANAFTPFFLPHLLALFLIGLYAGRRGVLQNIPDNLPWIRRVRNWGLLIGLIGNTVWSISAFRTSGGDAGGFATIGHVCNLFGAPALTFFYAASLLLVLQDHNLLQLWPGPVRQDRAGSRCPADARHLRRTDPAQHLVAESLPVRPCGVVLAVTHLPESPASPPTGTPASQCLNPTTKSRRTPRAFIFFVFLVFFVILW